MTLNILKCYIQNKKNKNKKFSLKKTQSMNMNSIPERGHSEKSDYFSKTKKNNYFLLKTTFILVSLLNLLAKYNFNDHY